MHSRRSQRSKRRSTIQVARQVVGDCVSERFVSCGIEAIRDKLDGQEAEDAAAVEHELREAGERLQSLFASVEQVEFGSTRKRGLIESYDDVFALISFCGLLSDLQSHTSGAQQNDLYAKLVDLKNEYSTRIGGYASEDEEHCGEEGLSDEEVDQEDTIENCRRAAVASVNERARSALFLSDQLNDALSESALIQALSLSRDVCETSEREWKDSSTDLVEYQIASVDACPVGARLRLDGDACPVCGSSLRGEPHDCVQCGSNVDAAACCSAWDCEFAVCSICRLDMFDDDECDLQRKFALNVLELTSRSDSLALRHGTLWILECALCCEDASEVELARFCSTSDKIAAVLDALGQLVDARDVPWRRVARRAWSPEKAKTDRFSILMLQGRHGKGFLVHNHRKFLDRLRKEWATRRFQDALLGRWLQQYPLLPEAWSRYGLGASMINASECASIARTIGRLWPLVFVQPDVGVRPLCVEVPLPDGCAVRSAEEAELCVVEFSLDTSDSDDCLVLERLRQMPCLGRAVDDCTSRSTDGMVRLFDLVSHPSVSVCYATLGSDSCTGYVGGAVVVRRNPDSTLNKC